MINFFTCTKNAFRNLSLLVAFAIGMPVQMQCAAVQKSVEQPNKKGFVAKAAHGLWNNRFPITLGLGAVALLAQRCHYLYLLRNPVVALNTLLSKKEGYKVVRLHSNPCLHWEQDEYSGGITTLFGRARSLITASSDQLTPILELFNAAIGKKE